MTAKMSGSIAGRVSLSQRAWTLPNGSPAGWWSLAPGRDPDGDAGARDAARAIPTEHREHAWLLDEDGAVWWALLDTRVDRVAHASQSQAAPEAVAEAEPQPASVVVEPDRADPEPAPKPTAAAEEPAPAMLATAPPAPEEPTAMPTNDQSRALVAALRNFDVSAQVADVTRGATVDRYMLKPGAGVKVSQIAKLSDDLALALDVPHVRVLAATGHVAVEVPAAERSTVTLADVAAGLAQDHPLRVPVGVDVAGHGISARLDRLPHLLVAGTTGSGKSTWTSAILAHLATHAEPADLQLALIDPKRVELAPFASLPHLWQPVARDVERAVEVLEALVEEVEARYARLETAGRRTVEDLGDDRPPYLLLVVDELADLMMTAGKRAESALVRILQIGRAAGVHAILATQRPSADVVTSLIKANTPSRLTFAVQSHVDSGVALGQSGAEALLGRGDGLWFPSGASQPERIQAPYVSTDELDEMLEPLRSLDRLAVIDEPVTPPTVAEKLSAIRRQHLDRAFDGFDPGGAAAPSAPTPPEEPERDEPGDVHERLDAIARQLEALTATPGAGPAPALPSAPPSAEREAERQADLSRIKGEILYTNDREEALARHYYDKGRRHGAVVYGANGPRHRIMLPGDWWLAVLLFVLGTAGSVLAIPVLPLAAGVYLAWTVTRRRTKITYNLEVSQ